MCPAHSFMKGRGCRADSGGPWQGKVVASWDGALLFSLLFTPLENPPPAPVWIQGYKSHAHPAGRQCLLVMVPWFRRLHSEVILLTAGLPHSFVLRGAGV